MSIKFAIDKRSFLENLLIPTSKLSENICLDFVSDADGNKRVKTLAGSADNSAILLANLPCNTDREFKCTIPDCKTFLRLFSGIENSEDKISLEIDNNVVLYSSPGFSFKYHLLDEAYFAGKKAINEAKLNQLEFDTKFIISRTKFSEILKFNSIIPDAEKLYFFTRGEGMYAKLGDEQKSNTNEICTDIAGNFTGKALAESIPVNIQSLLLLSFTGDLISISINHKLKLFVFETDFTKYVISGLVK